MKKKSKEKKQRTPPIDDSPVTTKQVFSFSASLFLSLFIIISNENKTTAAAIHGDSKRFEEKGNRMKGTTEKNIF